MALWLHITVIGCMAECLAIHNGRKKERVCVKETNENILKMIGGPMIEINRLDIVLSSRYIDKSALHYNKWLHTSVNRATFFPQLPNSFPSYQYRNNAAVPCG